MQIIQTHKDTEKTHDITKERFIELTEGRGYFKEGTALETLKQAGEIQTDYSYFKLKN